MPPFAKVIGVAFLRERTIRLFDLLGGRIIVNAETSMTMGVFGG